MSINNSTAEKLNFEETEAYSCIMEAIPSNSSVSTEQVLELDIPSAAQQFEGLSPDKLPVLSDNLRRELAIKTVQRKIRKVLAKEISSIITEDFEYFLIDLFSDRELVPAIDEQEKIILGKVLRQNLTGVNSIVAFAKLLDAYQKNEIVGVKELLLPLSLVINKLCELLPRSNHPENSSAGIQVSLQAEQIFEISRLLFQLKKELREYQKSSSHPDLERVSNQIQSCRILLAEVMKGNEQGEFVHPAIPGRKIRINLSPK